jgi:hypothetical protein
MSVFSPTSYCRVDLEHLSFTCLFAFPSFIQERIPHAYAQAVPVTQGAFFCHGNCKKAITPWHAKKMRPSFTVSYFT